MVSTGELRRSIGLPLLTFYGLGTILGAGIYVLIGEVAAAAGPAAPSAFVVAAVVAGMTAFSFAELSSRIPKSAGEAAYAEAAFGSRRFAAAVGWAVVAVGLVSAATMIRGFAGYLQVFVSLPDELAIVSVVLVLGAVAAWGIGQSVGIAAAITLLEIAGLLFVCVVAGDSFSRLSEEWHLLVPGADRAVAAGVISGAFIAFYAFIGFEDMVNVAEEVEAAEKTLPLAIVLAIVVSTGLYFLVAVVAVLAVPVNDLAAHPAPLALIVESRGLPPEIIAGISLFAVVNGALIQIIMASRVLYGLARNGLAPQCFANVNARTRTPLVGTATITVFLALLAVLLPLATLARITSFVALAIFCASNLALLRLKNTGVPSEFTVPTFVPVCGFLLCCAMLAYEGFSLL